MERALDDGDGSTSGAAAAKPKVGGGAADALGLRRLFANLGANGRTRTMSGALRADGGDADGSARAARRTASRRSPLPRAPPRGGARGVRGTLGALVLDAEAMVAALVDMEAAYFDADFFERLGVSEAAKDAAAEATREAENGGGGERRERKGGEGRDEPPPPAAAASAPTFDAPVNLLDATSTRSSSATRPRWTATSAPSSATRAIAGSVYAYVDAVRARMAKAVAKGGGALLSVVGARRFAGTLLRVLGGKTAGGREGARRGGRGGLERREACEARLGMLRRARAEIAAALG